MVSLAAIAVVCLVGPSVAVEVDTGDAANDDALRGWLATRLLEEGYDLASQAWDAATTVRVSEAGGGLAVDAIGDGVRSFAVEPGSPAVQRLEVLHRALQGVEATSRQPDEDALIVAPPRPGIVVRFNGELDEALLAEVANAAQAAGADLHAQAQRDDTLVCIVERGGLAEIGIGPAAAGCAPADTVAAVSTPSERREIASEIVSRAAPTTHEMAAVVEEDPAMAAIIADGERSAGRAAMEEIPPAPTVVAVEDGELPPMHGSPRAEVRLAAEGGLMVRGAPDAAMRGRLRAGRIEGIGARLELGVIPSYVAGLQVADTLLLVGPDWNIGLGERFQLNLGVTGGADIHLWSRDTGNSADVGWAVGLPVGASMNLRGGTQLHLSVHSGLAGPKMQHERKNLEHWERTAWRVGLAFGFSYGWRIE